MIGRSWFGGSRILIAGLVLGGWLVGAGHLAAQQGVVSGVVRDGAGSPVGGVALQVVDRDVAVLTSDNGSYRLELPPGTYEIRVSRIGFQESVERVEVVAASETELDIVMELQALELEGVVASVAARPTRRQELGTDLVRFDAVDAVEKSGAGTLSELLNNRAAGVSVTPSTGTAGGASRVRIRGATSITQDNNPIIYIDGVRASNETGSGPGSFDFANGQTISRLDDINPQEIQSIQVVKGPSAAALYGSEAASGVILIETKSGRGSPTEIHYSHSQGLTYDVEDYWDNFADVSQFGFTDVSDPVLQQWRPIENPVTGEVFIRHNPLKDAHTDPFRTARNVENRISIQGSGQDFSYFTALRHSSEEGTLRNNDVELTSFRGNFEGRPAENLRIAVNTSFTNSEFRLPDNDRSAVGTITNAGAGLPLFSFGTRADGSRGDCLTTVLTGDSESLCDAQQGNLTARFDKLETILNTQDVQRFTGSVTANWNPLPWATGRLALGVDFDEANNVNLVPLDPDRPFGANSDGLRRELNTRTRLLSLDGAVTATWRPTGDFTLTSSAGTQVFRTRVLSTSCQGLGGFASPAANACDAALTFSGGSNRVEIYEVGGFFQQQINFRDYLFGTGSVRVDDHSALGDEESVIVSPSANASALISRMPFWNVAAVSELRLRGAWGKAAQAPNPFAQDQTFEPIRVTQGGSQRIGVQPKAPGNPLLTAERSEEFEIGFDAGFLNNRITFGFTYYDATTRDAILPTNVAPSTGFTDTRFVNVGKIENSGVELTLGARLLDARNVAWDVTVQHSTQDPIITDMGGVPPITFGLGTEHQMFREGFSPGAFFGWEIESAERNAAGEIADVRLKPGNVGGANRPNDRYLGKAFPGNEQAFSTTVTLFDRLQVSTLFERAGDYVKLDNSQEFRTPFIPGTSTSREWAMRQVESTPEQQAAMEFSDFTSTGLFIQDASFVKWRELTVRYDLPERLSQLIGPLQRASFTFGGRNLATITDYKGIDPELSFDGGRDSFNQAEFFTLPPGRSFFAQLDLVF